jgi:hypothetical protein
MTDEPRSSAEYIVRLPSRIRTKRRLFKILARKLLLPDYFGQNFDSLEECLRDLSWLPPGPVVLIHRDVPFANESEEREIYLGILHGCTDYWRKVHDAPDRLQVVFPPAPAQFD